MARKGRREGGRGGVVGKEREKHEQGGGREGVKVKR